MGIRQVGIPVGGMIAGLLLPPLALPFGWRAALAIGGIIAIAGSVVCCVFYRSPPETTRGERSHRASPRFRDVVGRRALWWISLYGIAMIGAQFTFSLYIVVFAHERLGFSPVASGALLALGQGVAIVFRIVWGMLSDSVFGGDRRAPLAMIAGIASVGSFGVSFLEPGAPTWLVLAGTACLGASALGWQGVYVTAVSELVGQDAAGTALGFSLTIAQLGQLMAPPLFGYLADRTGSYQGSWIMLAAFVLLVSLPIHAVRKPRATLT